MKRGQVIYGVVWNDNFENAMQEGQKPENFGFVRISPPKSKFRGYLGVKLLDIEDLHKPLNFKILQAQQPSKEDIKSVGMAINKLPDNFKILVEGIQIVCLFY